MIVVVSIFVNIVLNILIFIYVHSSTRRVQPHMLSSLTNGHNNNNNNNSNQQPTRINRREIALLKQIIFMFSIFIVGWSPMYIMIFIDQIAYIDRILYESMVLLCEISLLSLIINLFLCNHELRKYLLNKIRLGRIH